MAAGRANGTFDLSAGNRQARQVSDIQGIASRAEDDTYISVLGYLAITSILETSSKLIMSSRVIRDTRRGIR